MKSKPQHAYAYGRWNTARSTLLALAVVSAANTPSNAGEDRTAIVNHLIADLEQALQAA